MSRFVFAQGNQIPDSVSLTDARFFKDKVTGQLFNDALEIAEDHSKERLSFFLGVYNRFHEGGDLAGEAVACTEISKLFFREGRFGDAFDWVNRALALDSLIPTLSPIRQRMQRNIAGIYTDFEAHKLALPHYLQALEIDMARDPRATPRRYRHCSSVAICFQKMGQMDSALFYYDQSISIADRLGERLWKSSARNNRGMALQSLGKLDTALAIFQKAYRILGQQRADELEFAMSLRDNIGLVLLQMNRPAEALILFKENLNAYAIRPNAGQHLQAGLRTTTALVVLHYATEAKKMMDEMVGFAGTIQPEIRQHYWADLLVAKLQVAALSGDWKNVAILQEMQLRYEDSLRSNAFARKVNALQDMLLDKSAHFKTEMMLMRTTASETSARTRLVAWLAFSAALLLSLSLLVILLSYRRRAERAKARHEIETTERTLAELSLRNEQLENFHLNQELEMKRRDITDYALVYSQRRKIFQEILEDLKQIKRTSSPEKSIQELILTLRTKIEVEGKLNLEEKHIEKVNHAFFEKLNQSFPDLGRSEQEICGMIRLGYSAKDIAAIRNIEPASVRIAKTRLKKKMCLGPETDLQQFLETI